MVEKTHKDVLMTLKFGPKNDEVQKELSRRNVLPCLWQRSKGTRRAWS